ncbi:MAG: phage holin family protein [Pseudonocardiaceae bacterium]
MRFLLHVVITAVALWVTTLLPGIEIGGSSRASDIGALVLAALLFSLVNAVVKPVVQTLGCVFYLITLGLVGVVVNALLFLLTARIADTLRVPFHVAGFVPALMGAIVVSVVSFVLRVALDTFESPPRFQTGQHGRQ